VDDLLNEQFVVPALHHLLTLCSLLPQFNASVHYGQHVRSRSVVIKVRRRFLACSFEFCVKSLSLSICPSLMFSGARGTL
jgi:hypothetical protein